MLVVNTKCRHRRCEEETRNRRASMFLVGLGWSGWARHHAPLKWLEMYLRSSRGIKRLKWKQFAFTFSSQKPCNFYKCVLEVVIRAYLYIGTEKNCWWRITFFPADVDFYFLLNIRKPLVLSRLACFICSLLELLRNLIIVLL